MDGQGLTVSLLAALIYSRHDHPPYEVRLLKFRRFAVRTTVSLTETFGEMGEATRRAKEIHELLKVGSLPEVGFQGST